MTDSSHFVFCCLPNPSVRNTTMNSFRPLILILLLLAAISGNVSTVAQDPDSENLIHSRHKHLHNAPHATEAPSDRRFFTTRNSEVVLPLTKEDDAFVFAVFGDRTGGPAEGVNVLADAVRDVNLIEPDMVMTVGDLINGYNQTPAWITQMKEYKSIMKHLVCPWFPVAGNHDVYWRPTNDSNMPVGQHDKNYELHFGPLWYSFLHKNCNFIALYSDEGDPETGEKNFRNPKAQKLSEDQFQFLKEALDRGKNCDHQFIFLHHPRWLQGGYGNDWTDRVHPVLKKTGNVTAVFAGHIHYMRYDPADGIEYVTLASVGAHIKQVVPEAGYLHQYHLVTVRPKQVAMTAYPVGAAMNVREITADLQAEAVQLARRKLKLSQKIKLTDRGPRPAVLETEIDNPTSHPIEFTVTPISKDSHWVLFPSHIHGKLAPGESQKIKVNADYSAKSLDGSFRGVELILTQDYLTKTTRYRIPDVSTSVELDLDVVVPTGDLPNQAYQVNGRTDHMRIPSDKVKLPQGPFTVEGWLNAKSFSERTAVFAKTQNSEYSIFASRGFLSGSVHLNGRYVNVKNQQAIQPNQWHHVALVYDEKSVVLFVDGQEAGRKSVAANARRTANSLPLIVGGDPDGSGTAGSLFQGQLDEFRLSRAAVYLQAFTPQRRLKPNDDTVLLYNFDRSLGPIVFDSGPNKTHLHLDQGGVLTTLAP